LKRLNNAVQIRLFFEKRKHAEFRHCEPAH
jgi:hypothetical protein